MKKRDELAEPNSCFNKANPDDYVFILIQKDKATPRTIRAWVDLRVTMGLNTKDDPKIKEALALADKIEAMHLGVA